MFFFFEDLYYIREIKQAFEITCLDKLLSDGYFDMSVYIFGRIRKEDMYARLTAKKSKFAVLYKGAYPQKETAFSTWQSFFGDQVLADDNQQDAELSYDDSTAIVNWVYRILNNSEDRISFTKDLFRHMKELHGVVNHIKFSQGVFYNATKVDLHIFQSVSTVSHFIATLNTRGNRLFFRGHANPNYSLRPSIMRSRKLYKNENRLYNDILIECPDDFEKCHTHLEKLVKMQHYGLPTRLLDITRNLLVALYFACEDHLDSLGELVLISAGSQKIKYPQSDTVSILASLPAFPYEKQQEFLRYAEDPTLKMADFNHRIDRLVQEVRLEKPAFRSEVKQEDVLNSYVVYALKNNSRIIKQDGAFILCGLSDHAGLLESFRYREKQRKVIVLIKKKEKILEELKTYSINHAALFPEIECVAEYLKSIYI